MYAVVANGIQTICKTQRHLDIILALYPYPKFTSVATVEEGREWLRKHSRFLDSMGRRQYGDTAAFGYARVRYTIESNRIIYNIDTHKVGFIRIQETPKTIMDSRPDLLRLIVSDVELNDELIAHHVIAIRRVLKMLGEFVDVDIVVPDISVFLAMTKYSGSNYILRGGQREVATRLAGTSFTIEESIKDSEGENSGRECIEMGKDQ